MPMLWVEVSDCVRWTYNVTVCHERDHDELHQLCISVKCLVRVHNTVYNYIAVLPMLIQVLTLLPVAIPYFHTQLILYSFGQPKHKWGQEYTHNARNSEQLVHFQYIKNSKFIGLHIKWTILWIMRCSF
jgi:hypothetical protein